MSSPTVRRAVPSDAAALARLTTQLGYPVSDSAISGRLARMIARADDCVLVAVDAGGQLLGWIHGFVIQLLESEYRVEIGGLVVDEQCRRRGVGRQLVSAIEDWARERGATEISVRCREERAESHRFYESLSFQHVKTQRVFRKRMDK